MNPALPLRRILALALASAALTTGHAQAAGAAEPVTFHLDWFPGPQFAGLYLAEARGYYRDAGLAVDFVPFHFGARAAEAIAASPACALGSIEGYIFLQQRDRGLDLQALAATLQESPAGFMSLDSSGIRSARDFAGHRIGVHKFADPLYRWFVARAGLAPDAATMVFVGDDLDLLVHGDVAAMQGYATEEYVRLRRRVGDRARFLSFRDLGFDSYSEILFTTPAQLQRHRAALLAFLAATRRGWADVFARPDAALAILRKRMGAAFDEPVARAALAALAPLVMPAGHPPLAPMSAAKWRAMQAACREMGLLHRVEPTGAYLPDLTAPAAPPR